MLHVKWVLCHQDMACPQTVDGGDNPQMWGGSCKCTEQPTTDSQKSLILQLVGWAWS